MPAEGDMRSKCIPLCTHSHCRRKKLRRRSALLVHHCRLIQTLEPKLTHCMFLRSPQLGSPQLNSTV